MSSYAVAGITADDNSVNTKPISYESAETLMAHGPYVLHEHVSSKLEAALGRALPQMEVRFRNLNVSADIVVVEDVSAKTKLPTLYNAIKRSFVSAKKHHVRKEILKNVSGLFRPGTVTLVLGQPSSGKSSLMKILSGRFPHAKNITVDGDITYNGVAQREIAHTLPQFAAYVDQRDKHYPVLTVKETLDFAHMFSGGELSRRSEELLANGTDEENAVARDAANALFEHYPDIVIQQLGLNNCQDTIVGDAMLRGVSGGERKRVTTGEMEFGMKYVTFMDEISTGLDSATTYDIINTQRSIAKTFRKTVVIALLQPSPEVFALFDDVLILNDGEVMYHGPREQVVAYFEALGFACPPKRDVADFLLDLGTKQQSQYETADAQSTNKQRPRNASEFADAFRQSSIYTATLHALETPHAAALLATVSAHMDRMPAFHQSFWAGTATLLRRQLLVQFRNTPFIVGRTGMVVIMGLLYATTYYQFDPHQVQVVMGVLYAAVLFLALGQHPQVPTFFAARDIFYKHRRANFFRTSSYVLANSLSQLPMILGETLVLGTLVYWMCGFVAQVREFVIFEAIVFLVNVVFSTWFFFLAAICPNNNIATPVALISILFTIIFSGFIVLQSKIPAYVIWIYWLNPVTWSIRALAVNQYRSSALDVCGFDGIDYCAANDGMTMGEYYLSLFDVDSDKSWIVYAVVFMVALYVLLLVMCCLALEFKRYEAPENVIVTKKDDVAGDNDDATMYVLAATPKSSGGGSGVGLDLNASDRLNSSSSDVVMDVVRPTDLSFAPVTLAFKDLWYTVPLPSNPKHETIDLLKGITGYALPGTITALMGSSGAGKTTLMDVIAGRKTGGKIRGEILLNGFAATDLAIRRCTGYCEQMDIHSETSTIREALTFSAFLRQDASVPASTKLDAVNECLSVLDLHGIADQMIRGRSVEQMKRLTIGVELAAQPSVLFLDEPTSGLDARSAKLVMDGVRKVADSGRTVVCTIHQPSTEVFLLFDSMLLLKRGGETVFFGDLGTRCHNLISYFESVPRTPALLPKYNPATWMLECIGAGVGTSAADATDFVEVFRASEQKQLLDAAVTKPGVGCPAPHIGQLAFTHKRAASSVVQMTRVVGRFMDLYWRTPSYNLTRFVMAVILALLYGIIFAGANYASYEGVNSGVGMLYTVAIFNGFVAFSSVIPVATQERPSFYRERASQTYNAFWYFVGSTLVELPYVFSSGLVFTVIFYWMVNFTGFGTFVLFWLNFSLMLLMQTYMGQLFAYALPSEDVAGIASVLVTNILVIFMGFSPPASAIPSGYMWLYTITPLRFPLSVSVALIFSNCSTEPLYNATVQTWQNIGPELGCQPLANSPLSIGATTVKRFTEDVFRMKHDGIALYFFVTIAYIVGFRVLGALALRYINHQKR